MRVPALRTIRSSVRSMARTFVARRLLGRLVGVAARLRRASLSSTFVVSVAAVAVRPACADNILVVVVVVPVAVFVETPPACNAIANNAR